MAINFPNNPGSGEIYTEGNKSWQWLGNRWGTYNVQNPQAFAFRNKIINGNFDIWQRGTSLGSGTGQRFLADRFLHQSVGSSYTVSRQPFTTGQTEVPGEPMYFHRTVVSSVASASNYCLFTQRIESIRTFAGKTVTRTFYAKADSNKSISVELHQNFGTGGTPSSHVYQIGVQKLNLTTAWQKFTITTDVPSILGKTIGTNNDDYLSVRFWFDAGSNFNSNTNSLGQQSGTFDIAQVQLEEASTATPFEQRPIGTELALCQRYYCKSFSLNTTPAANIVEGYLAVHEPIGPNGTIHTSVTKFPVTMRSVPIVTFYNPLASTSANIIYMTLANNDRATIASYDACPYGISAIVTSFSYSGTEPVGSLRAAYWQFTADAEL